jgi:metal-responsive CopG/Arc/MetJ family transcriptional regulator
MKSKRLQIVIPAWLKSALKDASESKGISMAEYIKDAIKEKLEREGRKQEN